MTTAPLSEQERFDRLRLARTERVGPVASHHLMGRYRTAAAALEAIPHRAQRAGGARRVADPAQVLKELEDGARLGARLILNGEGAFPERLAALDPPPPLLWALGDPMLLSRETIAVVGARVASASGQRFARGLAAGPAASWSHACPWGAEIRLAPHAAVSLTSGSQAASRGIPQREAA